MGTTFVTLDDTTGFWMRDGILELWLRLLALHIEESPNDDFLGRKIRDQWLLASRGYFNGHVPHDLETYANSNDGQQIIRKAIQLLMIKLKQISENLDGPTLGLLGIEGTILNSIETYRLIEVGDAFIRLMDGKIDYDVTSTEFMPGS